MYKLTKKQILSLIKHDEAEVLAPGGLKNCNFSSVADRTSALYYVFALATNPSDDLKPYHNLVQFFILTLHDFVNGKNIIGNFKAFRYAAQVLTTGLTHEEKKALLKATTPSMVVDFYSNISVLYDRVPQSDVSAIKVDNDISLYDLSKKLLGKSVKKSKIGFWGYSLDDVRDMLPDVGLGVSVVKDVIKGVVEERSVEGMIGEMNAGEYYFSTLEENRPTKETCEFFCLVIEDWAASKSQAEKMGEVLNKTLQLLKNAGDIKDDIKLYQYTEDLFLKHIPELISHIENLRGIGDFKSQIDVIYDYVEKINGSYIEKINFKLNVYNRYMKEKLANF